MCCGGSKTQTQQVVNKTEIPKWLENAYMEQFKSEMKVRNMAQALATPKGKPTAMPTYKGDRVAPFVADQNTAFSEARKNQSGIANAQLAANLYKTGANDYTKTFNPDTMSVDQVDPTMWSGDAANAYMNPYREQVIDSTVRRMEEQNERGRMSDQARAARSGAFGGSRHGVVDALRERGFTEAVGDTVARLEDEGYRNAQSMFQSDMGRRDAADQFNAGMDFQTQSANNTLGLQAFNANRDQFNQNAARDIASAGGLASLAGVDRYLANDRINTLLNIGGMQQNLNQTKLDTAYDTWTQQQQWPYQQIGWLASLESGQPVNPMAFASSTSNTTAQVPQQSALPSILGLGIAGLGLFSDRRLKKNVKRVGKTDRGLPIYTFQYKGDGDQTYMGVMADEVEKVKPKAVHGIGGLKVVDYAAL